MGAYSHIRTEPFPPRTKKKGDFLGGREKYKIGHRVENRESAAGSKEFRSRKGLHRSKKRKKF